jgi:hypothetical protein
VRQRVVRPRTTPHAPALTQRVSPHPPPRGRCRASRRRGLLPLPSSTNPPPHQRAEHITPPPAPPGTHPLPNPLQQARPLPGHRFSSGKAHATRVSPSSPPGGGAALRGGGGSFLYPPLPTLFLPPRPNGSAGPAPASPHSATSSPPPSLPTHTRPCGWRAASRRVRSSCTISTARPTVSSSRWLVRNAL